ncbi:hypothetical protein [Streptomyces alfalfae]|uniref:hypothetical protein n=1 Tax=Streptomyces alfalfae TaxID=1642299 RepID=UPI0028112BD8|nr:hypothetical protein [Streptomyces alfalfae]
MKAVRRAVLLAAPALCALASCGISTTGVVEAGGAASGVVPTIQVYFVAGDGTLVAVARGAVAQVDIESAVAVLLEGPTEAERGEGLATLLPPPDLLAAPVPAATATNGTVAVPQEKVRTADVVKVVTEDDRISIELTAYPVDLTGPPVDQLVCTALGAQRVAEPGAEPLPVTVTGPGGQLIEGTGASCPDG